MKKSTAKVQSPFDQFTAGYPVFVTISPMDGNNFKHLGLEVTLEDAKHGRGCSIEDITPMVDAALPTWKYYEVEFSQGMRTVYGGVVYPQAL